QAAEPQAPAPSAKKHRGAVPYVLGIAVVVLVGVLVWKFAGNGGVPDDGGNGAVEQTWQPTHYISSRLGEKALVLRKRELTADEQQQVTTDAALNGETYAATLRAGDSIAIVAEAEGYYTVLAKGASGERYYLPREAQTDDWLIKLGEPEKEVTVAAAAKREREAPVQEPEPVAPPAPKPRPAPVAAADRKPAAPAMPTPVAVDVAGGTFQMGSNDGEDEEQPLHSVTLSSYRIGKYEVTFAEYDAFCEATGRSKPADEGWGRDQRPVINVNWHDMVVYCEWLTAQTGQRYRLPTEAEWEYAARGGSRSNGYTYSGSNSVGNVGWYSDNSGKQTHPVGGKGANELGIYDMTGNVWEWCSDWYESDYYGSSPSNNPRGPVSDDYSRPTSGASRVLRGGSWFNTASYCRATHRSNSSSVYRSVDYGFRVVLSQ